MRKRHRSIVDVHLVVRREGRIVMLREPSNQEPAVMGDHAG